MDRRRFLQKAGLVGGLAGLGIKEISILRPSEVRAGDVLIFQMRDEISPDAIKRIIEHSKKVLTNAGLPEVRLIVTVGVDKILWGRPKEGHIKNFP